LNMIRQPFDVWPSTAKPTTPQHPTLPSKEQVSGQASHMV